ncbi:lambda-exonuclease family protein [Saccharopolyspora shandongensis]|uniref:YqaJ viral recombinase family nuclease n=1 Tax=Saccharopolyspora shandongensis TaxID=418495 RepID=UPI003436E3BA
MTRAAVRVGTFEPGSLQWHAARDGGIGGSEIAAVLGLSPWESRFSLWHKKNGLAATGSDNEAMRWGRRLENLIADWFAEQHPEFRVRRTGTWRNRLRPFQIGNPDRLLYGLTKRAVLGIKTARDSLGWGRPGTDEIPVYYRAQVLWYLDTLGFTEAYIAVLIGGSDYREYHVPYDAGEAATLRKAAAQFITSLESGTPPDIDTHAATYQVIRELHPDIDDVDVEIAGELAERYRAALADHKAAEALKRQAAAEVLDALGRARRAVCAGEPIAIRVPGRGDAPPSLRPSPVRPPMQKVSAA